ncbi:MAG: SIS domain-containing protein [Candidatus Omnitrophica bacterium]|nr:SIS domain-containing protein [Candidatus Omnitrophota bacterium]
MKELKDVMSSVKACEGSNKEVSFDAATSRVAALIMAAKRKKKKVIIVGNGGSSSIANHIATDVLKNCKIPALSFSDSSLITCLSNDLGYECVFSKPIELLAQKGDILLAISSSGKSKNILNAVSMAKRKGCFVVTLSGFSLGNPLRKKGSFNFYVPSHSYGHVEISHLAICHNIVDKIFAGNY